MIRSDYWSPGEFAELINISKNYLQHKVYYATTKPIAVGGKYIIRKRQFFTWYKNGGKEILDETFPNSIVAHRNIENAMIAYYMSFYREGRSCG